MLQKDISKKLHLTKGRISQIIKHLKALNYIVANRVGIINELALSPKGNSLAQQFNASCGLHAKPLHAKLMRIHNQEYKISLKTKIKPFEWADKTQIKYKMNKLRGHIDIIFTIDNVLYRLTPNNLIIHIKDMKADRDFDLLTHYQNAKMQINEFCKSLEAKGLPLQRFDKENYKLIPIKTEIAFEDDDIAVESEKKEKEIKIYDKEDGKLRFSVDWSPKVFPEAEFFHPMKAIPDAMNWQTSTKDFTLQSIQDLFDGGYEQFKKSTIDMFNQFTKLNGATMETLSHFAKNLDEHVAAISELKILAQNINKSFTPKTEAVPVHSNSFVWVEIKEGVEVLKHKGE